MNTTTTTLGVQLGLPATSRRRLALATGILAGALVVVPTIPVASSVPDTPTVTRVVHSDVNLAASVSAGTAPRAGSMAKPGPEPWPEPEPTKTAPRTKTAPAPKASPRGPIPVCPDCGRFPPPPPKVN